MLSRRLSIYVSIIVLLFGALGCHQGGEEGLPPEVALSGDRIFQLELGSSVTIAPSFSHLTEKAIVRWILDDTVVGHAQSFTFFADAVGVHYLTVEVTTAFGTAFLEMRIDVTDPGPEPGFRRSGPVSRGRCRRLHCRHCWHGHLSGLFPC